MNAFPKQIDSSLLFTFNVNVVCTIWLLFSFFSYYDYLFSLIDQVSLTINTQEQHFLIAQHTSHTYTQAREYVHCCMFRNFGNANQHGVCWTHPQHWVIYLFSLNSYVRSWIWSIFLIEHYVYFQAIFRYYLNSSDDCSNAIISKSVKFDLLIFTSNQLFYCSESKYTF